MAVSENVLTNQVALEFGAIIMGNETRYETGMKQCAKQGMKQVPSRDAGVKLGVPIRQIFPVV